MANAALPAGRAIPRRRALFGLFDAEGWGWASVKAAAWFVIIIMLLGYIPDRAYYLTVNQTLDLGLLAWSPVNLCPPGNENVPCPAPAGAALPWHQSPTELDLPTAITDAGAVQVGSRLYVIGGSPGQGATDAVSVALTTGIGNYAPFAAGPALPAPRADASVVVYSGSIYVIGGRDADGKPTDTVFSLTPPLSGDLPAWKAVDALKLPGPLAGAAVAATGDGIVLVGGANADGPTTAVWKARFVTDKLTAWAQQPGLLYEPDVDGVAAVVGNFVWLMGGSNAQGPVKTVQVGVIGAATAAGGKTASPSPSPSASAAPGAVATDAAQITQWRVSDQTNLPEPRTNPAGFTANGTLYLIGGSDGSASRSEMWWAIPDATGSIPGWKHLAQTDLGIGLAGGSALASGSQAFVFGGETPNGIWNKAARSNLAPQAPFFRVGLVGATIPALKIDGEIGQQLGYLNAAGVGTVNFILLLLIGWAYAHKEQTRAIVARIRRRRGR